MPFRALTLPEIEKLGPKYRGVEAVVAETDEQGDVYADVLFVLRGDHKLELPATEVEVGELYQVVALLNEVALNKLNASQP